VNGPREAFLSAGGGQFRILSWGDGEETVLFLHGLPGVAEVWLPTIDSLSPGRRYVAIDQRGHGQSWAPVAGYSAADMFADARGMIDHLGAPVHLVGHSMGARVAMVLAARVPALLRSVAIVDIGPEASKANIESTVRGIGSRPERFGAREDALAVAFRNRTPTERDMAVFLARLKEGPDGSLTWRASVEALVQCVTSQRARAYWREWRSIAIPALYIRGEASNEVSPTIAARMRATNPGVVFETYESVGHNIPLLAPERLAGSLERFWTAAAGRAT
jgi:pimeloyl-ACP methyl ester carboxylesterase